MPESLPASRSHRALLGPSVHRLIVHEEEINWPPVQPTIGSGVPRSRPTAFPVDTPVRMFSRASGRQRAWGAPPGGSPTPLRQARTSRDIDPYSGSSRGQTAFLPRPPSPFSPPGLWRPPFAPAGVCSLSPATSLCPADNPLHLGGGSVLINLSSPAAPLPLATDPS